jgi:hypothetical protein
MRTSATADVGSFVRNGKANETAPPRCRYSPLRAVKVKLGPLGLHCVALPRDSVEAAEG